MLCLHIPFCVVQFFNYGAGAYKRIRFWAFSAMATRVYLSLRPAQKTAYIKESRQSGVSEIEPLLSLYLTEAIGKKLAFRPHVQEVHYVAGEDAFLIKLRGPDTEEIGRLIRETIRSINGVQLTKTSIVMSTYKETAQFPIDDGEKQS